jgi:pimeloyl-ACP methyl ester carboxylesterase
VQRIFTRGEDRDLTPELTVRDAQAQALAEWGIPSHSELARLAAIDAPTLVANGDKDIMIPTENSYLLAGHLPNAKLIIYPGTGHGFLFERPKEFAADVHRFLADGSSPQAQANR